VKYKYQNICQDYCQDAEMKQIFIICLSWSGVYAQEDENIDDIVDVEGEEGNIITDEETEEDTSNASSDADTTILFTKPVHNALSTLGILIILCAIVIIIFNANNVLLC